LKFKKSLNAYPTDVKDDTVRKLNTTKVRHMKHSSNSNLKNVILLQHHYPD